MNTRQLITELRMHINCGMINAEDVQSIVSCLSQNYWSRAVLKAVRDNCPVQEVVKQIEGMEI